MKQKFFAIITICAMLVLGAGCGKTPGNTILTPKKTPEQTGVPTKTTPYNTVLAPEKTTGQTEVPDYVYPTGTDIAGEVKIDTKKHALYFDGEWVYFQDIVNVTMYKTKLDGSGRTTLFKGFAGYMSVKNDWLYLADSKDDNKLYKVKSDGNESIKLNDDSCTHLNIYGDWIYYIKDYKEFTGGNIYKIKTDGTGKTQINSDASMFMAIDGNFLIWQTKEKYIYKMDLNGGGDKMIVETGTIQYVKDDYVYYRNVNYGELYRKSIGGNVDQKITLDRFNIMEISGDWIYYCYESQRGNLFKIKTDGTGKTRLVEDDNALISLIAGDWIYYNNGSDNFDLYRVKIDGTDRQKVE